MALIQLPLDTGERSFADIKELSDWHARERQAFAWLHGPPCNGDGDLNEVRRIVDLWLDGVQNFIDQYRAHGSDEAHQQTLIDETVGTFSRAANRRQLITSESADAQFVFGLRDRDEGPRSAHVAAYALNFLLRARPNHPSGAALEGTYWALQYHQGSTETVAAQQKALDALCRDFAARLDRQHDEAIQKNQAITDIQEGISEQRTSQENNFQQFMERAEKQLESAVQNFDKAIKRIKDTYYKELALHSSVTYWEDKGKQHKTLARIMGGLSVGSAFVTATAFVCFSDDLLDKPLSEVTPWAFGVLFVISTFGIWLTRLLTKMFISNLHLRTDAEERVTMIQAYLAMLRDGDSPARGQEQVILTVLFRPSVAGYIKEEGPAALHDVLTKFTAKSS